MVDSIFSIMNKLSSSVPTNKVEINYTGRKILELIGGPPGCGKSTLAPNAYEINKKDLLQELIKQYNNLNDIKNNKELTNELVSEMESLQNSISSDSVGFCSVNTSQIPMNSEQELVLEESKDELVLEKPEMILEELENDIVLKKCSPKNKNIDQVYEDLEQIYEDLEQIVKHDMQNNVPLIQVVDTFTERKYLDPYLALAIEHGYEVIIKYPQLMYYKIPKNNSESVNDQITYLQLLNSKKLKPIPKDKMYESCLNSLAIKQWINNIKYKNGTDPEKWSKDVQPFMNVKSSKKYREESECDSDVKIKYA